MKTLVPIAIYFIVAIVIILSITIGARRKTPKCSEKGCDCEHEHEHPPE
jgi:hypothetical protein